MVRAGKPRDGHRVEYRRQVRRAGIRPHRDAGETRRQRIGIGARRQRDDIDIRGERVDGRIAELRSEQLEADRDRSRSDARRDGAEAVPLLVAQVAGRARIDDECGVAGVFDRGERAGERCVRDVDRENRGDRNVDRGRVPQLESRDREDDAGGTRRRW